METTLRWLKGQLISKGLFGVIVWTQNDDAKKVLFKLTDL